MDYTGERCVLCEKKFTEDDDVVVCPDCGSPHHRECYAKLGRCVNEAIHAECGKWQRVLVRDSKSNAESRTVICPLCSGENPSDADTCQFCGAPLSIEEPQTEDEYSTGRFGAARRYFGFNPNEDMDGVTLREVFRFVGTNTIYYIPIFKRMKDLGIKISFNVFCLFFPPLYFANRRMWGWALITAFFSILFHIPSFMLALPEQFEGVTEAQQLIEQIIVNKAMFLQFDNVFRVLSIITSMSLGLFGNYLYFRFTVRNLRKLKAKSPDGMVSTDIALSVGGVRPMNIILIIFIMGAIFFGMIYAVFGMLNISALLSFLA